MRPTPLALLCLAFALTASANAKPNLLLILADDLCYGDLGCYNEESKVPTPNLDRLAGEGMRFTDAHSPATVCTPTRYSLMTGPKYIDHPGSGGNRCDTGLLAPFALPETDPDAPAQFYDLAADPGETTNLHSRRPEIAAELKALLEESKSTARSRL